MKIILQSIRYPEIEFKLDYKIDEFGNVYSPHTGQKMALFQQKDGYIITSLYLADGSRKRFRVHRLVMNTFQYRENSEELQVNHIDGNKANNNLENLEWCTRSENLLHAFRTGLEQKPKGEINPNHKLTEKEVIEICELLLQKVSYNTIAQKYNVSKGTIAHIKQKRTWVEITQDYNFD